MTPAQLHILQHSLGLDQYGRGESYRNHFVTGEGSKDHAACMELVALGWMTRRTGNELSGGDDVFHVTDDGRAAVRAWSPSPPTPPKLTRSQQRYRDFLNFDGGCSFIEYVRMRARADAIQKAGAP